MLFRQSDLEDAFATICKMPTSLRAMDVDVFPLYIIHSWAVRDVGHLRYGEWPFRSREHDYSSRHFFLSLARAILKCAVRHLGDDGSFNPSIPFEWDADDGDDADCMDVALSLWTASHDSRRAALEKARTGVVYPLIGEEDGPAVLAMVDEVLGYVKIHPRRFVVEAIKPSTPPWDVSVYQDVFGDTGLVSGLLYKDLRMIEYYVDVGGSCIDGVSKLTLHQIARRLPTHNDMADAMFQYQWHGLDRRLGLTDMRLHLQVGKANLVTHACSSV
jgi:hypothetical protein